MRMEEGRGEVEVKRKKCEGSMKREKMMGKGRTKKKKAGNAPELIQTSMITGRKEKEKECD